MLRTSVIVLAVTLWSCKANATDTIGLGTLPCSRYSQKLEPEYGAQYLEWIMGWLSGFNAARLATGRSPINLDKMKLDAMLEFVQRYCGTHPNETVARASLELVGQIANH
ncbi:hypothetical protein [Bradyrhizobium embrapense]